MSKKWLVMGLLGHLDCFWINKKMLIFDLAFANSTLNRVGCSFFVNRVNVDLYILSK